MVERTIPEGSAELDERAGANSHPIERLADPSALAAGFAVIGRREPPAGDHADFVGTTFAAMC
jgi:hypothetical protein